MSAQQPTFGFIGLGNMGMPISQNLASYAQKNSGPKVQVWNRTRSKIESELKDSYCEIADSIEELVKRCDIVHTCLANDEVALSVYKSILSTGKQGILLVDHSTLFPTTASTLQSEVESHGSTMLSCPVFGPPAAAKSAGLLVVLSGPEHGRQRVKEYVVPALGKGVIDCGDDVSKGALLKILGNNCILGTIELLSESFTLAEKTGFDPNVFYQFIEAWFPAAAWVNYGKKIRDGSFSGKTGFTITGGMKDANYIRRLGASSSTPTPIIDQAWNHLTTASALGGDSLDWSACAAGMRVTAGLPPFKGEDFTLSKSNGVDNGHK